MKKALTSGIMSFVLIYAACILFGPANQDLSKTIFQYLSWSLPASSIIGTLTYMGICKDSTL
jgi:hypothetical protein